MRLTKQFALGCLAASALLLTTACSQQENFSQPEAPQNAQGLVFGEGSNIVTLTINAEGLTTGTRAVDYTVNGGKGHISDGTKVDALVFAVYEVTDNGDVTIAPEFGKGGNLNNVTASENQSLIQIEKVNETWPIRIQLATNPEKKYRIALWAQNSQTTAFSTADLKNVTVDYTKVTNNYELSDAFCKVQDFSGDTKSTEVILRRPFAQINVGTSGADYKHFMKGEKVYPNRIIQQSKIVLKGAANKINVVEDVISSDNTDAFNGEVTFEWNKLASYVNVDVLPVKGEGAKAFDDLLSTEDEEWLYVKLNNNQSEPLPYLTSYPTAYKDKNTGEILRFFTETFKYMSMCYVLVPANSGNIASAPNATTGSVLEKVEVYFAEDGKTNEGYAYLTLTNVPAQRNWRTNIIGGLNWMKDPSDPNDPDNPWIPPTDPEDPDDPWTPPTDPDDPWTPPTDPEDPDDPWTPPTGPDDPTTLFNFTTICIHLDPIYDGEYNGVNQETTIWVENEFPGDLKDEGCDTPAVDEPTTPEPEQPEVNPDEEEDEDQEATDTPEVVTPEEED